jgi:hypothetical protein
LLLPTAAINLILALNKTKYQEQTTRERLSLTKRVRNAFQDYILPANAAIWQYRNYYHHNDWTECRNSRRREKGLEPLTKEDYSAIDKETQRAKREGARTNKRERETDEETEKDGLP